jgi:hypothetical protein
MNEINNDETPGAQDVPATLDDETITAINEGEDQADRGESIDFEVFREQWRKRLGGLRQDI